MARVIAGADYDLLLADLYAGIVEPDRLQRFLRRLGDATRSHVMALIRHDHADLARSTFQATGVDGTVIARYEAGFRAPGDKLWFDRSMHAMRTGSVFNGEDWVSKRELKRTRYYADVLREIDTAHSVAICGLMSPSHSAFITPCRSERSGPYDGDSLRLFRQVGPHWVNAYALMSRFEALRGQEAGPAARGRAMFLLDAQWRWVSGNAEAAAMVARGWWQGRRGGRLEPCSMLTRERWNAALRGFAKGVPRAPDAVAVQAVAVHAPDGQLVAFASIQAYGAACAAAAPADYVVFVRPLQVGNDDALGAQLQALFGLTSAETALALALRRHGEIARAAEAVGITEGSARTRLQAVYDKTGQHRQAELLRMLEALADALA